MASSKNIHILKYGRWKLYNALKKEFEGLSKEQEKAIYAKYLESTKKK